MHTPQARPLMHNSNIPADQTLPSTAQLIRSTILAALGAAVLLVAVVLPAEFGIDPTGFGRLTGLQKMGEIKASLAAEAKLEEEAIAAFSEDTIGEIVPPQIPLQPSKGADAAAASADSNDNGAALRKDTTTLSLAPDEGAEIKVALNKGEIVRYEWTSTGALNFDNHADSKALGIDYHGYSKGKGQVRDAGEIEAAFDGKHGWFWRNRTKQTVTVTLTTEGAYSDLVRVD
jgi:hypothetical protein